MGNGDLAAERRRILTPSPSTPEAVASVVVGITRHFDWKGRVGCGFPGVVDSGVVRTAANVSKKWIDVPAAQLFEKTTGCSFTMVNDADAAGLAEMRFGAGRERSGVVLMLTFGTGIGTALFVDGKLVPNTELGHLELPGREAEHWASEKVRVEKDLSWKQWGERVNVYLNRMHAYFWPELVIVGGGASKKFEKFSRYLSVPCEIVPAKLRNRAGVVGAALAAAQA